MNTKNFINIAVGASCMAAFAFISAAAEPATVQQPTVAELKAALKPKFTVVLRTYVYNGKIYVPTTVFRPGNHGLAALTVNVPPVATGKRVDIDWSASASLAGLTLPIALREISSFQDKYPTGIKRTGPLFGTGTEYRHFRVGKDVINSTFRVTATTTIATLGTLKTTVSAQIKR